MVNVFLVAFEGPPNEDTRRCVEGVLDFAYFSFDFGVVEFESTYAVYSCPYVVHETDSLVDDLAIDAVDQFFHPYDILSEHCEV